LQELTLLSKKSISHPNSILHARELSQITAILLRIYVPHLYLYFNEKDSWYTKSLRLLRSAECQWLMPVILATQEAEIRRIEGESQPGQIVHKTLSRKKQSQKWAGGVTQGVGLSSSLSTAKKKKTVRSLQLLMAA
jgi:hypothetical protein